MAYAACRMVPAMPRRPCSSHNSRLPGLWYNSLSLHRFPVQRAGVAGHGASLCTIGSGGLGPSGGALRLFSRARSSTNCRATWASRPSTPAPPVTPFAYPAVHDMPPPRETAADDRGTTGEAGKRPDGRARSAGNAAKRPPQRRQAAEEKEAGRPPRKTQTPPPRMAQRPTHDKSLPGSYRPAGQGSRPKGLRQWKTFTASAACRLTCSKR